MIEKFNWEEAMEHLDVLQEIVETLGVSGMFYMNGIQSLRARYLSGERTEDLHQEIMEMN